MVRVDAANLSSRDVNKQLKALMAAGTAEPIMVENPHSMHNLATALIGRAEIVIDGSAGFYLGGFLEGPSITVRGNAGWYVGDNMMAGEIVVERNAGSNCGPSMLGGTIVVRGNAGSRAGYGIKGGNLIVCGSVGRWSGQMTMGGRMVVLGAVGQGLGESMYRGIIHARDPEVQARLGGNVEVVPTPQSEQDELGALFARYGIDADPAGFTTIVPRVTGRHKYTIFEPCVG